MNKLILREFVSPKASNSVIESIDDFDLNGKPTGKSLYLKGIIIQGGIRNANQRIYPVHEIARAVDSIKDQLKNDYSVCGQLDHPEDLKISLDRISHMITDIWMDGSNGHGKLKILPTEMGNIARTLIESGVKLGVSSRGSGNVNEATGNVSDFEIITVDIVSTPSAPGAFPTPVYEHIMNTRGGYRSLTVAHEAQNDPKLQKYLKESLLTIIKGLKPGI